MPTMSRAMRAGAFVCVALSGFSTARADSVEDFYRGRTLYTLVGVSPGGEYDLQARLVGKYLGKFIPGHPTIVIQNMTGATGMVAANYLYKVAPKDGTYLAIIQNGLPTSQAVGLEGVQYDAAQYNWLGSLAPTVETMVAWKTSGVKTINQAKEKEIIAGSNGSTGITMTFPLMLNDLLGTRFKMVTGYTGSGPLNIAMEAGEVSARNSSWTSWKAARPDWLKNGDISVLVFARARPNDIGAVPALDDLVAPDDRSIVKVVTAGSVLGHPFAMPPGVPPERVAAVRKAFADMAADPEFQKEALATKIDIDPVAPALLDKAVAEALNAPAAAKARARRYYQ